MTSCRGCGSLLDLTKDEVSQAVDKLIEATRPGATAAGGVCPLCGHSVAATSRRRSLLFTMLLALVVVASGVAITYYTRLGTERRGRWHSVPRRG